MTLLIPELEIIRIVFVFVVLGINTITDLKKREIAFSDRISLLVGGIGFGLFFVDIYNDSMMPQILMMVICITFVLLLWRFKVMASGDIAISLILCVTLPTNFVPIITILLAVFLSVIITLSYNVTLNIKTKLNHEVLFHDFESSKIIKIIAFIMTHRKRSWEKHVISVERGTKIDLFSSPLNKEFSTQEGEIVGVAFPLIPFLLVSFPISLVSIAFFVIYTNSIF